MVLAAFAAVALAADGVMGFLLAFIAALLLVDRAWPITGVLFNDAQHAYARLAHGRRLAAAGRRLKRRPAQEGQLPYLPDELEAGAERRTLAVQAIALDTIVGTTEPDKARAFDCCFRPPEWSRGRWQLMWIARSRGISLPPISVYRVGDRHYVRDGHHRVSVARALGESSIEAEVIQLRPTSHLGYERRERTLPGAEQPARPDKGWRASNHTLRGLGGQAPTKPGSVRRSRASTDGMLNGRPAPGFFDDLNQRHYFNTGMDDSPQRAGTDAHATEAEAA